MKLYHSPCQLITITPLTPTTTAGLVQDPIAAGVEAAAGAADATDDEANEDENNADTK